MTFKNYRKKPVVIQAKQMDEAFTVSTLENRSGEVQHGKAGDYLIIGVRGEKYPCDKEIFEETYDKIAICEVCKEEFVNNTKLLITVCEKCRSDMDSTTGG